VKFGRTRSAHQFLADEIYFFVCRTYVCQVAPPCLPLSMSSREDKCSKQQLQCAVNARSRHKTAFREWFLHDDDDDDVIRRKVVNALMRLQG
jgi:hypothetical protein